MGRLRKLMKGEKSFLENVITAPQSRPGPIRTHTAAVRYTESATSLALFNSKWRIAQPVALTGTCSVCGLRRGCRWGLRFRRGRWINCCRRRRHSCRHRSYCRKSSMLLFATRSPGMFSDEASLHTATISVSISAVFFRKRGLLSSVAFARALLSTQRPFFVEITGTSIEGMKIWQQRKNEHDRWENRSKFHILCLCFCTRMFKLLHCTSTVRSVQYPCPARAKKV